MNEIKIAGCSIACLYAETDKCQCSCNGATHGACVKKAKPVAVKCSPAAEKRCKEGNESGECKCACGGINHGIYKHIPDFESTVKITHFDPQLA